MDLLVGFACRQCNRAVRGCSGSPRVRKFLKRAGMLKMIMEEDRLNEEGEVKW